MVSDPDKVFKALADRRRRHLPDRLHGENGQTLGERCRQADISRQAITKHLAQLKGANLVVTIWREREKLPYLNPVPVQETYQRWIGKFEGYGPITGLGWFAPLWISRRRVAGLVRFSLIAQPPHGLLQCESGQTRDMRLRR
ncbi:helix-turn-helix domain-containing protein [Aquisalimonas sp.]|uniref:winged helix-turn-helix domain-containing protein n=1 Tax=Aquisalimonas sp. TaxID=1872621 RepID=UPI0025BB06D1|nr:helix-turn-helix domain-containing protein [Aquisalimonas sp.]